MFFFIAYVFHYPIQIIDALSSEVVPGFGVKISTWRVIFEPFIGIFLFYLRADQPILQFTMLLIWILVFYLFAVVRVQVLDRDKGLSKTVLRSILVWLKNSPLIIIIWLGILIFIIFVPIPANTISNDSENAVLINTHSHTEYSHDGIISQKGLQKWHGKHNFDAFFITDHNHHEKTMEAVQSQREGSFPLTPLMMCGEEFSGSNHITLLGLKRNFVSKGLNDQQVIDTTHYDGGVAIVAHWFDGERESIPFFIDMNVDGFEIVNAGPESIYDKRIFNNIVSACTNNGLIMNSGADYHGYGSICFTWNALEIPEWHKMGQEQKEESILDILRQKDMSKIRVLIYDDRKAINRDFVILSPLITIFSYIQTLNLLQLLSWLIWLSLFQIIRIQIIKRKRLIKLNIASWKFLEILTFFSGGFMLILGFVLFRRSSSLMDYNDIYLGYGISLMLVAAGSIAYLMVLLLVKNRLKRSKFKKK